MGKVLGFEHLSELGFEPPFEVIGFAEILYLRFNSILLNLIYSNVIDIFIVMDRVDTQLTNNERNNPMLPKLTKLEILY